MPQSDRLFNKFTLQKYPNNTTITTDTTTNTATATTNTTTTVTKKHNKIVNDLGIGDRVYKTVNREAFNTIKYHKENFHLYRSQR